MMRSWKRLSGAAGCCGLTQIADLFNMAEVLGKQPRTAGPRLTIVTNAGGPGVWPRMRWLPAGANWRPLSAEMLAALDELLPPTGATPTRSIF